MIVVEISQTAVDIATWPTGRDTIVLLRNFANDRSEALPFARLDSECLEGLFSGCNHWQVYFVATSTEGLGEVLSLLYANEEARGVILADGLQMAAEKLGIATDSSADLCGAVDTHCRSSFGWRGYCTAGPSVLDALKSVRHRDILGSDFIFVGLSTLGRCVATDCSRRGCRSLFVVDLEGNGQAFVEQFWTKQYATPIHVVVEPCSAATLAPDAAIVIVDPVLAGTEPALLSSTATEWAKGRSCFAVLPEIDGGRFTSSLTESVFC